MIKILVADDQELICQSLKIILNNQESFEVVGTASNGEEVLQFVKKNTPDVILMDVRMPLMDGVQCTKIIKEYYPDVKIIILSTFDDDQYIYSALKYGASGYLLKGVTVEQLSEAIITVNSGRAMINPDIATKVIKLFSKIARADFTISVGDKVNELTKTDWKIIEQVGYGASNKEISDTLKLSEGTVRNYLSSILSKLDLRDRTQLAIWAVQTNFGNMVISSSASDEKEQT